MQSVISITVKFQHTAARRRLHNASIQQKINVGFQHTAARRRLRDYVPTRHARDGVSTHSRTKAAASFVFAITNAFLPFQHTAARRRLLLGYLNLCMCACCFNTQPHEGGCDSHIVGISYQQVFQHTAARRRLLDRILSNRIGDGVSTHSRTKAAAVIFNDLIIMTNVSTHSRTKAAAYWKIYHKQG